MKQGSSLEFTGPGTPLGVVVKKQAVQFQAVQELAAVCSGIQHIAMYCVDQGHVTLDRVEEIAKLAHLMSAKLSALGIDIAN